MLLDDFLSPFLQLLEQVGYKPSEMTYSDGTSAINVPKNRYPSIVPCKNLQYMYIRTHIVYMYINMYMY